MQRFFLIFAPAWRPLQLLCVTTALYRILHKLIPFLCACVGENYLGGEGSRKIGRSSAVGDEDNQDDQQLHSDTCMLEPLSLL